MSDEHIYKILSSYSVPKLRHGPLTLNIKMRNASYKIIQPWQYYSFFLYALNRNNHAELYLPGTFQTSDIELLSPKLKLNIHVTKSPKRDHIYKFCLYTLEEHKCLILTSLYVPKLKYSSHAEN